MSERITRRKTGETRTDSFTGNPVFIWSLERGDEVLGQGYAVYKTRTQRFFEVTLTLDGHTVNTASYSMREAVAQAEREIAALKAASLSIAPAGSETTV